MLDRILTKLGQNDQWVGGYKSYQQFDLKGHVGVTGVKNVLKICFSGKCYSSYMLHWILMKLGQNDQWVSGYKYYQQFDRVKKVFFYGKCYSSYMLYWILMKLGQKHQWVSGYKRYQHFDPSQRSCRGQRGQKSYLFFKMLRLS